jgi:transcriptional regulator with XRE-family HTH domain
LKIKPVDVDAFKKLIMRKGLSQRSLGSAVNISEPHACNIINGNRSPSPSLAKNIADILGVDFDTIFFVE